MKLVFVSLSMAAVCGAGLGAGQGVEMGVRETAGIRETRNSSSSRGPGVISSSGNGITNNNSNRPSSARNTKGPDSSSNRPGSIPNSRGRIVVRPPGAGAGRRGGRGRSSKMSYLDKTVQITELLVPRSPRAGRDVTLTCRFRLGGPDHRLYTVNWWRGRDQFYTYKDNHFESKHAYSFRGIRVKMEESTAETVVLEGVTEETSGVFKCEVMGEGPSFRTAVDTKRMTVVVPPQQLRIEYRGRTQLPRYRLGQTVYLNCTARGAKPRAELHWEVNGAPVRESSLYRFPDTRDNRGRVTSTLGLRWRTPDTFRDPLARVTCRASVQGHATTESQVIYLDPASSITYHHRYSSPGTCLHPPWTIFVGLLFLTWTIPL